MNLTVPQPHEARIRLSEMIDGVSYSNASICSQRAVIVQSVNSCRLCERSEAIQKMERTKSVGKNMDRHIFCSTREMDCFATLAKTNRKCKSYMLTFIFPEPRAACTPDIGMSPLSSPPPTFFSKEFAFFARTFYDESAITVKEKNHV